jgi:hypothetical protein
MQIEKPNMKVLGNISIVVLGIIIASYGKITFILIGFFFQACGIAFDSIHIIMIQKVLSQEYKMDPLIFLYYFTPVYLF